MLAAGLGVGLSSAPLYAIGVFIGPLNESFGWSRTEITMSQVLVSLVVALLSPLAGILVDRVGARRLVLPGTIVASVAAAALSLQNGSLLVYLALYMALAMGIGMASAVIWTRAIVDRFIEKRGLALSIALCGSNLAGAAAPLLCRYLIETEGWRTAYLGLGLFMFLSVFPTAYLHFFDGSDLRRASTAGNSPAPQAMPAHGLSLIEASKTLNFWALAVSFLLAGGGITVFVIHLYPMQTDRGLAPMVAASIVGSVSLAAILGRLIAGYLMDRVFATRLAAIALSLPILACLLLLFAPPTYLSGLMAAVLLGLATGAEFSMISFLTARYFGLRKFGVISSVMFTAFTAGSIIMPPAASMMYDSLGSYDLVLKSLAACFAIAVIAMLSCSHYPDLSGKSAMVSSNVRARHMKDRNRAGRGWNEAGGI